MTVGQHLASILLQGLVVFATAKLVPGFKVKSYGTAIGVAIVYGVLSWLLKTVLVVLSIPFIVLTLGLFLLVINAFLLWLTDKLLDGVEIQGKFPLMLTTVLITVDQSIVSAVVT